MRFWKWLCRWWYCGDGTHVFDLFPDKTENGYDFFVCRRCCSTCLILDVDRDYDEWLKSL